MKKFTVSVNVEKLYERLVERGKMFVKVEEIAGILCISEKSAGRLLATMARQGFLEKWGGSVYVLRMEKSFKDFKR
ncbi:MAG: hypothetical protein QXP68_05915 [Thermosphaera sp.]